ncbi:hypothetical protein HAX54_036210 [Datura stramonium]|uniref:Uncharacterized protein n=1 Tax=Datura stramonium TaxID=4076 RepID=A0ABS8VHX2_DATST|nr:hypothetical protein [Datura stramonium]
MSSLSTLKECECVAKRSGVGGQSTISGLIETKQHGTYEIDRRTGLLGQKEAAGTSEEPGAMLALQNENALLRGENTTLKKQVEDLTKKLLHDQHATNEYREPISTQQKSTMYSWVKQYLQTATAFTVAAA